METSQHPIILCRIRPTNWQSFYFLAVRYALVEASTGASVPWTTYEAENMTNSGGTIIGPPTQLANINATLTDTIQMEASGGEAVELTGTGQYVEFTAQAPPMPSWCGIVCRTRRPEAEPTHTISLYINTNFVQKLPVTSQYTWLYGSYPFVNTPSSGSPRNFFDEVRLNGLTINAGDTVRIEKDADDTAAYYVIDLVDLENVARPAHRAGKFTGHHRRAL